jgi:hypothetical protein
MIVVMIQANNGQYNNNFGTKNISNNNKIIILLNYCSNFMDI